MKYTIFNENGKVGLLNEFSKVVQPAIYDSIVYDMQEQYALIKKDGKWGMLSYDGSVLCDCVYDTVHLDFVVSDYACVGNFTKDGNLLYGLINKQGDLVLNCQYEYIESTPIEDKFIVGKSSNEDREQKKMLYGLVNNKGKIVQAYLYTSKDKIIDAMTKGLIK